MRKRGYKYALLQFGYLQKMKNVNRILTIDMITLQEVGAKTLRPFILSRFLFSLWMKDFNINWSISIQYSISNVTFCSAQQNYDSKNKQTKNIYTTRLNLLYLQWGTTHAFLCLCLQMWNMELQIHFASKMLDDILQSKFSGIFWPT